MKKLLVLAAALLLPVAAWADVRPPLLTEREAIAQVGVPDRVMTGSDGIRRLFYGHPGEAGGRTSAGHVLSIRDGRWIGSAFINGGAIATPESYPRLRDMVMSKDIDRGALGRVKEEDSYKGRPGFEMLTFSFRGTVPGTPGHGPSVLLYRVNCVLRLVNGRRPGRGEYRVWMYSADRIDGPASR